MNSPGSNDRYAELGVSAVKEGVHAAIRGQDQGLFPGAFCKIIPDLAGNSRFCSIVHADGAGTKVLIPWFMNRLGLGSTPGFLSWRGAAIDSAVMNLDDLGCVGATGPFHLCNTIDRNKMQVGDEVIKEIIEGYQWLAKRLAVPGIDLQLTGGETADVPDLVRTLVINSTVVTRLPRKQVIDASRIRVGDVIVGFSSTGQAVWEDEPNSGIGSNGLTLARHTLLNCDYRYASSVTCAPEISSELTYSGPYHLEDKLPLDSNFTIGSALASPTRTYLPLIKWLIGAIPHRHLHALIHCSGGGQTKIGHFGPSNVSYEIEEPFIVPKIFLAIQAQNLSWHQMFQAFSMGWRLEAVVPKYMLEICLEVGDDCGIAAKQVGRVCAWQPPAGSGQQRQVRIHRLDGEILSYHF